MGRAAGVPFGIDVSEKVLWTGRPRQGLILRGRDVFLVFFGMIFLLVSVSFMGAMIRSGQDTFAALFVVPHFLFGAYMTAVRPLADMWMRRHTFYAVTSDRVVIHIGRPREKVHSYDLQSLPSLALTEGADFGTIRFREVDMWTLQWHLFFPEAGLSTQFTEIEDAMWVYGLIRTARGQARPLERLI